MGFYWFTSTTLFSWLVFGGGGGRLGDSRWTPSVADAITPFLEASR